MSVTKSFWRFAAVLALCTVLMTHGPCSVSFAAAITDSSQQGLSAISAIQASTSALPVGVIMQWPLSTGPVDADKWLDCDGQSIDAGRYPELHALMGANTPDLRTRFLRGGTKEQTGIQVADSIRSHSHGMDQHAHALSGSAGGQSYLAPGTAGGGAGGYAMFTLFAGSTVSALGSYSPCTVPNPNYKAGVNSPQSSALCTPYGAYIDMGGGLYGSAAENANVVFVPLGGSAGVPVSAMTGGGSISGWTSTDGPTATHAAGGSETAPAHAYVRFLVRAKP